VRDAEKSGVEREKEGERKRVRRGGEKKRDERRCRRFFFFFLPSNLLPFLDYLTSSSCVILSRFLPRCNICLSIPIVCVTCICQSLYPGLRHAL
jgi:hypothetical protein